ncbi:hypothetical protein K435DRAFT_835946 [Dendrothele bispora CBS 962.96]|uniref:DUF7514 domain-containing protein n=1 Tax=Dendrothele bispora (strain CBS 962.96) TaxID=1314807 RepID=A0A4S8MKM5_DENBC|nr:hypothetical protein K435DRAFT_835946 [Dendrothele bispora CBS 962.96]
MTLSTNTFYCDSCSLPIPVSSPRVHCLSPACADNYDLCATCALGERFIQGGSGHLSSHPTQVYKVSGNVDGFLSRSGLDNGALRNSVTSTATITYFDRAVGSPTSTSLGRLSTTRNKSWVTHHHHHRRSSGSSSISSIGSLGSISSTGSLGLVDTYIPLTSDSASSEPDFNEVDSYFDIRQSPVPPLPAAFQPDVRHDTTPRAGSGWTALFMSDMTPTTNFLKLLNAIFSSLDNQCTGYLTPEVYSRFLDDLGYEDESNIWKSYLRPIPGFAKEDVADQALRSIFDLFSIEYTLGARTLYRTTSSHNLNTPPADVEPDLTALTNQLQSLLSKGRGTDFAAGFVRPVTEGKTPSFRQTQSRLTRIRSSSFRKNSRKLTMPLLTRPGFVALSCLNVLCDPDAEWMSLCRVLRNPHYQEELEPFLRMGPLPRAALPAYPDQASLQRVQDVFDHAERMKRVSEGGMVRSNMSMRNWDLALPVGDSGAATLYTTCG